MSKAAKTRLVLVKAFIRSWRSVATPSNCARSFESVGIFPLSPFIVLNSPFVTSSNTVEADRQLNMKVLTDPNVIAALNSSLRRERLPEISNPADVAACERVVAFFRSQKNGALLSGPPTLFWFAQAGGGLYCARMMQLRDHHFHLRSS